jgi:hypothetical protein
MGYGGPVVCSTEVVGDAGAYFDPTNSAGLRSTLEHVATNEGLQANLRIRAYRVPRSFLGTAEPRRLQESVATSCELGTGIVT